MKKATVYTSPGCWACRMTKALLDKHGVPYETVDIAQDPAGRTRVQELGYSSLPVVEAAGRDWYGHRPDLIAEVAPQFAT